MTVEEIVRPHVEETYGSGSMTSAFIEHLAESIEHGNDTDDYYQRRGGREYMIHMKAWDWFTGGSTAEAFAAKVEADLKENGL